MRSPQAGCEFRKTIHSAAHSLDGLIQIFAQQPYRVNDRQGTEYVKSCSYSEIKFLFIFLLKTLKDISCYLAWSL